MSPSLAVQNLAIDFKMGALSVQAVRGITYHLDPGETLAILGESGSGKSVQASAIMGILDQPPAQIRSGSITFDGHDLLSLSGEQRRDLNGRRIAMIFQDPLAHLNPVYSVGWQIAEALTAHGLDEPTAMAESLRLMERTEIPNASSRRFDYPHQFSGGQRQRVMIAMALAMKPAILIADEPTTALDVTVQAQILKLLKELQVDTGMGLMLITHDLGIVSETADRVAVMQKGRIVEDGTVAEIFDHPVDAYTRQLMAAIPGRGPLRKTDAPAGSALLQVQNLRKYFPLTKGILRRATGEVVKAVDDISFELNAGETLGIVGESGSGKSTVMRCILRLDQPTGGTISFAGKSVVDFAGAELLAYRRKLQIVFQDPYASLNPRMSVFDIVSEPWAIHNDVLPKRHWHERAAHLLDQVGLTSDHLKRYPHQFSGGQRQRIAIARALALEPQVLICDEAVSALDVSIQSQIIELLAQLRDRLGLAMVFIAHDLPVVRDIADRVLVMQAGRIVEQGTTRQLFETPAHPYTQALLAASPLARAS